MGLDLQKVDMQKVKISKLKLAPDNPRLIRDDKFKKLVSSLTDFPQMAEVRPLVVNQDMVILGGNMRYRAMKEAGWKEAPVVVVDWDEARQKEFVIKDNVGFGEWDWDSIANEWGDLPLDEWGLDIPAPDFEEKEIPFVEEGKTIDEEFRKGDVIELGGIHRIIIGANTDENLQKLTDGVDPDFTTKEMPYLKSLLDFSAMEASKLLAANEVNIRYCGIAQTGKLAKGIVEEWVKKFPKEEVALNGQIIG
jgi:hypothetical protein